MVRLAPAPFLTATSGPAQRQADVRRSDRRGGVANECPQVPDVEGAVAIAIRRFHLRRGERVAAHQRPGKLSGRWRIEMLHVRHGDRTGRQALLQPGDYGLTIELEGEVVQRTAWLETPAQRRHALETQRCRI